jgi:hypothetical protein
MYSHLYRPPVVRSPTTLNNTNWGKTRRPIMNETTAPTAQMPVIKAEEFVSMVHKVFQSNIRNIRGWF